MSATAKEYNHTVFVVRKNTARHVALFGISWQPIPQKNRRSKPRPIFVQHHWLILSERVYEKKERKVRNLKEMRAVDLSGSVEEGSHWMAA